MKCEKCGNEYPSSYYFATSTVCNDCFQKMTTEEQQQLLATQPMLTMDPAESRTTFGKRFGAAIIDYVLLGIIILVVFYMVGFIDAYKDFMMQAQQYAQDKEAMSEYAKEFFKPYMQDFYFMYFLVLVYFSLEFIVGASLGKLILGIRIAGNDMKPASFGNLIYRYLLKHSFSLIALIGMITGIEVLGTVGMLVGLVVFIGLFFVLSHNRLSFHDMLAKTAVYNKNFIDIEESTEN